MREKHSLFQSIIAVALVLAIGAVYLQVRTHQFLLYDDPAYITGNPHVTSGLTWDNIVWAFTSFSDNNWFPLTWISHMIDVQLFGLAPGPHHLVNVALHMLNTLLLLQLLNRLTGSIWRSAMVAALFALHPIHVESVAWAAERKDVLSGMFFLLTLHAYCRYRRHREFKDYILVMLLFALGLMAKPMLVSLPLLMLLLDYWPLSRSFPLTPDPQRPWWPIIAEKIPFFALAVVSCAVTISAQKGGISSIESLPFSQRLANAAMSYVAYLCKTMLPIDLAVFYPLSRNIPAWQPMGACLLLVVISLVVWLQRRVRPYLLVGWLWYLVMLVPVIGIVQVGLQSRADRYSYLPLIGIFVMAVWLAADLIPRRASWRLASGATAAVVIVALAGMTWKQTRNWRDDTTLFTHALAVTHDNYIAYYILGLVSDQKGDRHDARRKFDQAIAIAPWFVPLYMAAGTTFVEMGSFGEAVACFEEALRIQNTAGAHFGLATALHQLGETDEAVRHYRLALEMDPTNPDYLNNFGIAMAEQGHLEEAIGMFRKALTIEPKLSQAQMNLDKALRLQSPQSR